MFSDMELIGVPQRIVFSDRGLKQEQFETRGREDAESRDLPLSELPAFLEQIAAG